MMHLLQLEEKIINILVKYVEHIKMELVNIMIMQEQLFMKENGD
jgi:hypothetical protein